MKCTFCVTNSGLLLSAHPLGTSTKTLGTTQSDAKPSNSGAIHNLEEKVCLVSQLLPPSLSLSLL